ncbi:MAG: helix-turn-helix domain-containing protein [Clostridia bacterium]|nr:helix-turn-helix domain-containing protein [Clostridia bacterium]
MLISQDELKENIAKNLVFYRKQSGLTQLDLAEKLNYSDKAVSKWERGESLPDVYILTQIAELFGVTVDCMLGTKVQKKPVKRQNRIIITALSMCIVWLAATVCFVTLKLLPINFVCALPACAVVAVVFCSLWWNRFWRLVSVSALIWSSAGCIYAITDYILSLQKPGTVFSVAAVLQVMAILWFLIKKQ